MFCSSMSKENKRKTTPLKEETKGIREESSKGEVGVGERKRMGGGDKRGLGDRKRIKGVKGRGS